jgi:chromate reductase
MQSPEGYIHFKPDLISDDGSVTVESTKEFLQKFMQAFADHIGRCSGKT